MEQYVDEEFEVVDFEIRVEKPGGTTTIYSSHIFDEDAVYVALGKNKYNGRLRYTFTFNIIRPSTHEIVVDGFYRAGNVVTFIEHCMIMGRVTLTDLYNFAKDSSHYARLQIYFRGMEASEQPSIEWDRDELGRESFKRFTPKNKSTYATEFAYPMYGSDCVICMTNSIEVQFNCGHGTCTDCNSYVITSCHICRQIVNSRSIIFPFHMMEL